MKGRISDKQKLGFLSFPRFGVYDIHNDTINGIPVIDLELKVTRKVPDGCYCICHICQPPRPLTKEQDKDHDRVVHNIKR